jgi:CRP-like cAMP-binding protein
LSSQTDVAHDLAGIALFADLSPAQLDKVGQAFEEQWFQPGERAQRQGFVGSGFHVILDGEAEWRVDGELVDRTATTLITTRPLLLKRGDWFGELTILFDEPSISDVIAATPLRCIVLPPQELEPFLFGYPQVMYRLLLGEARRLRDPLRWQR